VQRNTPWLPRSINNLVFNEKYELTLTLAHATTYCKRDEKHFKKAETVDGLNTQKILDEVRQNRARIKLLDADNICVPKSQMIALCDVVEILITQKHKETR